MQKVVDNREFAKKDDWVPRVVFLVQLKRDHRVLVSFLILRFYPSCLECVDTGQQGLVYVGVYQPHFSYVVFK